MVRHIGEGSYPVPSFYVRAGGSVYLVTCGHCNLDYDFLELVCREQPGSPYPEYTIYRVTDIGRAIQSISPRFPDEKGWVAAISRFVVARVSAFDIDNNIVTSSHECRCTEYGTIRVPRSGLEGSITSGKTVFIDTPWGRMIIGLMSYADDQYVWITPAELVVRKIEELAGEPAVPFC